MASAKEFTSLSVEDHIRTKDMWAGTIARIPTTMMLFTRSNDEVQGHSAAAREDAPLCASTETIQLSPALFKCVDEPIVNALDQAQRDSRTTEIRVTYASDGRITIANNGAGIPVVRRENTQNMYVPQFIFGVVFTGSNMTRDETSTLGGTNGIGVKITNIHSREFTVITHDQERGKIFTQTWTEGMKKSTAPVITQAGSADGFSGTTVAFLLDYARFKTEPREFERVVFTRAVWCAMYLAYMLPHVTVYWNGVALRYSRDQYSRAIFSGRSGAGTQTVERICSDQRDDAVIICSPDCKRLTMSLINGIVVPSGNHLDHIYSVIKDATKARLAKKLRTTVDSITLRDIRSVTSRLATIVIWRAKGVHWSGQSKDRAQFQAQDLDAVTPSDVFVGNLADTLSNDAIARMNRMRGVKSAMDAKTKCALIDKYTPARRAGSRESAQCRLFLAEGDSAKSQVEAGISNALSFDYYGVLSLRGVIPNVRKQSITEIDGASGAVQHKRSKKLIDNKFLTTLVQVLGIDFNRKYDSAEERAKLRYGGVIGCVDQDLDGIGNIFSLVLSMFHLYWPALVKAGYVQRLATPIIRAYPRAPRNARAHVLVLEFYSDEEYRAWYDSLEQTQRETYKIRYYKGLGKHSAAEMKQIMSNLDRQIITYKADADAQDTFDIYLGHDPALRRDQLSQPPPASNERVERRLRSTRKMPASYHLLREAHTYQLDNLQRKIVDAIGGANQVGRKILDGCLKIFAQTRDERKVADIAGTISTMENYHHGEASLQDAIIRRGFIAPGGNQLPLLRPIGNFGTRLEGGHDAAQARYVEAGFHHQINDILYPSDDYPLLEFHVDEGKRGEPRFFVPIIPMAIVENVDVPAHGWNIRICAREVMDVIENTRRMIMSDGAYHPARMRPCCFPTGPIDPLPSPPLWESFERVICDCTSGDFMWRGYIIERASMPDIETWSLGTYEWLSEDTISITELPLCVWTRTYIKDLAILAAREHSVIKKYQCAPSDTKVDIQVTFDMELVDFQNDGTNPRISLEDPVVKLLHLRARMSDNINLMMPDDSVRSFATYEEVMINWFPTRKEYYMRRIRRQREILQVWICYYENIVRYITSSACDATGAHSLSKMTVEEAKQFLLREKYALIDLATLESPEMKYIVDVADRILRGEGKSHNYILNLRERDITVDGCVKYQSALDKKRTALRELEEAAQIGAGAPFIGARIWLGELATLTERINHGRATHWQYGDYQRFTFA